MNFPVYRKLSNNQRFYKIDTLHSFTEIQIVGKKVISFNILAKQFPEINLIQDLIQQKAPYLLCSQSEFEAIEKRLKER